MSTFKFTEIQIIDVWVSDITKFNDLTHDDTFNNMKEHLLRTGNIRLEAGLDVRLIGNDFYTKQTNQVKEQIPELIVMIEQIISKIGFTKCSVSWHKEN